MTTSIQEPGMYVTDWGKLDRADVCIQAFISCHAFREENGALPRPGNEEDAQRLVELCLLKTLQKPRTLKLMIN